MVGMDSFPKGAQGLTSHSSTIMVRNIFLSSPLHVGQCKELLKGRNKNDGQ